MSGFQHNRVACCTIAREANKKFLSLFCRSYLAVLTCANCMGLGSDECCLVVQGTHKVVEREVSMNHVLVALKEERVSVRAGACVYTCMQ